MTARLYHVGLYVLNMTREGNKKKSNKDQAPVLLEDDKVRLFTKADGVDDLQKWHERLGHVGPSYCK